MKDIYWPVVTVDGDQPISLQPAGLTAPIPEDREAGERSSAGGIAGERTKAGPRGRVEPDRLAERGTCRAECPVVL